MSCPDESLFVGLLQGDLDVEERLSLDDHIDTCSACARLVVELARLLDSNPSESVVDAALRGSVSKLRGAPTLSEGWGVGLSAMGRLTPGVVGDYRLMRPLGQGGMGIVYLAEHQVTGARVALKTLRALDARLVRGLRQEIRALKRVHHPAVVRVLDDGLHEGLPWYAMELLQGETFQSLLDATLPSRSPRTQTTMRASWTHQLMTGSVARPPEVLVRPQSAEGGMSPAVERALHWIAQLCHALAYIHGEGIVHCDLKPSNVLIAQGKRAVLVDFGLAARQTSRVEASALAAAGFVDGTAFYMCPERIEGRAFDARADLYALGCMLYQVLTGRVPFLSTDARAVLVKHVVEVPDPPSSFGEPVPQALEAVVMALLSKRPEDRPGHAHVVLKVLRGLGIEAGFETPLPAPQPYLYSPPLSGRGACIEVMESHLARLEGAEGSALWFHGESGVGKTRLALELVKDARELRIEVLTGQCVARGGDKAQRVSRPLQAFEGVLRQIADVCLEGGEEICEAVFGARGRILAPFAPFLEGLPGLMKHPEPAALAPEAARLRAFRALAQAIERHCAGGPLLLVLDDLQWSDALSLGCLRYILEVMVPSRPWLVVPLARAEEMSERLRQTLSGPEVTRFDVTRLDEAAVGAMVARMLGLVRVPDALASFVCAQSGGNPFFVAEYLRLAVEQGLLTLDSDGRWQIAGQPSRLEGIMARLPAPASVQSLIERRLGDLREDAEVVCAAASVLGRQVNVALLEEVAELSSGTFDSALLMLRRRQILEDAGEEVRFVHDKLRETAFGRLPQPDRQRWHLRAAEGLSRRRGEEGKLGWHWEQAREFERAREAYLKAADKALGAYAIDAAEMHFDSALSLFEASDSQTLAPRLDLVESVFLVQARHEEAEAVLEAIIEEAEAQDAPLSLARALRLRGVICDRTGRMDEAMSSCEDALAIYETHGDLGAQGTTLDALATAFYNQNRFEEAEALYLRVIDLQRLVGDKRAEGIAINDLGLVMLGLGRFDRSTALLEQASDLFEQVGHRFGVGSTHNNIALVLERENRTDEAMVNYRHAHEIFGEVGHRQAESISLNNIAHIYLKRDDYDNAVPLLREVIDQYHEIGFKLGIGIASKALGDILRAQGALEEGTAYTRAAMAIFEAVKASQRFALTMLSLAMSHRSVGEMDKAIEAALDALERLSEPPQPRFQADACLFLGWVEIERDDIAQALFWSDKARELIERKDVPRQKGRLIMLEGALQRLQGRLHESQALLNQSRATLEVWPGRLTILRVAYEQGLTALALGQDATEHLHKAIEVRDELSLGPRSLDARKVARLERMVAGDPSWQLV